LIDKVLLPLVNKFYKANRARSRAKSSDRVWVIKQQGEIVAALRVVQIAGNEFLTGVQVAEQWQGKGVATLMLQQVFAILSGQAVDGEAVVQPLAKPCYTFPYLHLIDFYTKLGWRVITKEQLPVNLHTRYERYCGQGRDIGVMVYHPNKTIIAR